MFQLSEIQQILLQILKNYAYTRPELVEISHIPRTTIYDNLEKLIQIGLVRKYAKITRKQQLGRPDVYFGLFVNTPEELDKKIAELKKVGVLV